MKIPGQNLIENIMWTSIVSELKWDANVKQSQLKKVELKIISVLDVVFSTLSSTYRKSRDEMKKRVINLMEAENEAARYRYKPVIKVAHKVLPNKREDSKKDFEEINISQLFGQDDSQFRSVSKQSLEQLENKERQAVISDNSVVINAEDLQSQLEKEVQKDKEELQSQVNKEEQDPEEVVLELEIEQDQEAEEKELQSLLEEKVQIKLDPEEEVLKELEIEKASKEENARINQKSGALNEVNEAAKVTINEENRRVEEQKSLELEQIAKSLEENPKALEAAIEIYQEMVVSSFEEIFKDFDIASLVESNPEIEQKAKLYNEEREDKAVRYRYEQTQKQSNPTPEQAQKQLKKWLQSDKFKKDLIENPGTLAGFLFFLQAQAGAGNLEDAYGMLKAVVWEREETFSPAPEDFQDLFEETFSVPFLQKIDIEGLAEENPEIEKEAERYRLEQAPFKDVDVEGLARTKKKIEQKAKLYNEEKEDKAVRYRYEQTQKQLRKWLQSDKFKKDLIENPSTLAGFLFFLQAQVGLGNLKDTYKILKTVVWEGKETF